MAMLDKLVADDQMMLDQTSDLVERWANYSMVGSIVVDDLDCRTPDSDRRVGHHTHSQTGCQDYKGCPGYNCCHCYSNQTYCHGYYLVLDSNWHLHFMNKTRKRERERERCGRCDSMNSIVFYFIRCGM